MRIVLAADLKCQSPLHTLNVATSWSMLRLHLVIGIQNKHSVIMSVTKQTTNKQTHKQANISTSDNEAPSCKQTTNKQHKEYKQTNIQTNKHRNKQTNKPQALTCTPSTWSLSVGSDLEAEGIKANKQTNRQTNKES